MAIYSGFSHKTWCDFPVRYVKLPEGKMSIKKEPLLQEAPKNRFRFWNFKMRDIHDIPSNFQSTAVDFPLETSTIIDANPSTGNKRKPSVP